LKAIVPQLKLEVYEGSEPYSEDLRIQSSKIERIKNHSHRSTPLNSSELTTQQWELSSTKLHENVTELQRLPPVAREDVINPLKDHQWPISPEMLRIDSEQYVKTLPAAIFAEGLMQLCVCGREVVISSKKCPYCGRKF
jgi:hypothetical protein